MNTIIDKAVEVGADAIGLSALLVSTSKQMPLCVQELDKRGMQIPGADRRRGDQPPLRPARAVRRGRACRTSRASSTARMRSRAWRRWTCSRIRSSATRSSSKNRRRRAQRRVPAHDRRQGHRRRRRRRRSAATSRADNPVPRRRSGARASFATSRSTRCSSCSTSTSSTACSGARAARASSTSRRCKNEFEPTLARLKARGEDERMAQAAGGLRLFPRAVAGQRPHHLRSGRVLERRRLAARDRALPLPAQDGRERLCLADYFRSVDRATSMSSRSRS